MPLVEVDEELYEFLTKRLKWLNSSPVWDGHATMDDNVEFMLDYIYEGGIDWCIKSPEELRCQK